MALGIINPSLFIWALLGTLLPERPMILRLLPLSMDPESSSHASGRPGSPIHSPMPLRWPVPRLLLSYFRSDPWQICIRVWPHGWFFPRRSTSTWQLLTLSKKAQALPDLNVIITWIFFSLSPKWPWFLDQVHGTPSLQTTPGRCLNSVMSLCSHRPLRTENMVYFWSPYLHLAHLGPPITLETMASIHGCAYPGNRHTLTEITPCCTFSVSFHLSVNEV